MSEVVLAIHFAALSITNNYPLGRFPPRDFASSERERESRGMEEVCLYDMKSNIRLLFSFLFLICMHEFL